MINKIWAVALIMAGIGVFFRIPQVMPQIEKIEYFSSMIFFIRFCFYLIGILLIGGGIKKLKNQFSKKIITKDNESS
ncbi:MAG: hypothetical protein HQK79_15625 [Desulfobacterales bacterium]|nr:hypothetical protein [Desulfobacterales bacterium]MBF0395691.1 hypothetical protein [Desulfobacterales bacterium]